MLYYNHRLPLTVVYKQDQFHDGCLSIIGMYAENVCVNRFKMLKSILHKNKKLFNLTPMQMMQREQLLKVYLKLKRNVGDGELRELCKSPANVPKLHIDFLTL